MCDRTEDEEACGAAHGWVGNMDSTGVGLRAILRPPSADRYSREYVILFSKKHVFNAVRVSRL